MFVSVRDINTGLEYYINKNHVSFTVKNEALDNFSIYMVNSEHPITLSSYDHRKVIN